jgi:hypothetical protein
MILRLFLWIISGEFKGWLLSLFLIGFGLCELAKQELSLLCWKKNQGIVIEAQTKWIERKGGIPGAPMTVRSATAIGLMVKPMSLRESRLVNPNRSTGLRKLLLSASSFLLEGLSWSCMLRMIHRRQLYSRSAAAARGSCSDSVSRCCS